MALIYKFRGECQHDIDLAKAHLKSKDPSFSIREESVDENFGDTELSFSSTLNPNTLDKYLGEVDNPHIMVETLNLASRYTGERTYTDYSWVYVADPEPVKDGME
jgi:hypothetical protein